MERKGVINKNLTKKRYPYLSEDIKKGKVVYEYHGNTYGVISSSGIAVTDSPGKIPFYEVPRDAVTWD